MQTKDYFNKHLVFRFSEFKQFMQNRSQGVTEKNCYMTLYNYCKKGKLAHVRKGFYALVNDSPYQIPISPLLIAGKATEDALLVYHSALEAHNIAYTEFNEHTYLTAHRTNDFTFQNQHYRAIYKPSFDQITEVESISIQDINIKRTSLERTIVDVLDRPDISGGWEEVSRSLDRVVALNAERAIDYALSLGYASVAGKLGYFFEHRPDYLSINTKIIERLLPHIPKNPYSIDRKSKTKGIYIKKWNIIVPEYLHKRLWEEPDYDVNN